jgi:hypothetical protein
VWSREFCGEEESETIVESKPLVVEPNLRRGSLETLLGHLRENLLQRRVDLLTDVLDEHSLADLDGHLDVLRDRTAVVALATAALTPTQNIEYLLLLLLLIRCCVLLRNLLVLLTTLASRLLNLQWVHRLVLQHDPAQCLALRVDHQTVSPRLRHDDRVVH